MAMKLGLRQLESIVAIAECGGFSSAAERLHVSQPALSRTVRLAEEALGTRVFDRDTRKVTLTPAGIEFLAIARRIVSEFSDSMGDLAQFMEGRRGRVRVSALPSMAQTWLIQAVAAFNVAYPDVEFLLRVDSADNVLGLIESRSIDIGLSVQPPPDGRFTYEHLLDDEFVLVCRNDDELATRSSCDTALSWSVLAKRRFIATTPGSNTRTCTDAALMEAGLTIRPSYEVASSSLPVIGSMVAANLGLSVLPASSLSCLNQPGLVARRLVDPLIKRRVGIVAMTGRTLAVTTENFCAKLRQFGADARVSEASVRAGLGQRA